MASGRIPYNPATAIGRKMMAALLQELKLLRTRKVKRTVHRDANQDIEYTTEETI